MEARLLLFGFEELPVILAVEAAARPFGAKVTTVARRDYNRPLAALAGLETGADAAAYTGGPLGGRMIVLCGLDRQINALLPALAGAGAGPGCLKAVLTDHNRSWNAVKLFQELEREHRAMGGR